MFLSAIPQNSVFSRMDALFAWLPENELAQAAAVLLVSIVAAKVASWLIESLLKKIAKRTTSTLDDRVIDMLHGPIIKTLVLIGVLWAASRIDMTAEASSQVSKIVITIILVVWTVFFPGFLSILLQAASGNKKAFQAVQPTTLPLFKNLSKVVVFGVAAFIAITVWDIDATGFLASAGIVGVAVGFAAQDTLANLFAGVFIIADAPYRVGDFIVLDTLERGQVTHIGLRSTRILTRDDIEVSVPNAVMGSAKIVNETGGGTIKRRLRIPVGVAYGSDVDAVRACLMKVASQEERVCDTPEPRVRIRAFGASSLDFELLCWIHEPLIRGQAVDALLTGIYTGFQSEGIEIPFPQQDIHVRTSPPSA